MSLRIQKINAHIQNTLSSFLQRELSLKSGVFITVVKVDTTRDLRYARVFVSVFPESEASYAMETLKHEKSTLQKELHKNMHVKILPKISFILDDTEVRADVVEQLFRKIEEEKGL